jgi:hypothetical protein
MKNFVLGNIHQVITWFAGADTSQSYIANSKFLKSHIILRHIFRDQISFALLQAKENIISLSRN